MAWESNSFPKPPSGRLAEVRRSIKTKDLEGLDEGTYFLRVDAYDSEGALLTTTRRMDPKDETSRAENESEPFLLVRQDVVIDDADVRATFVPSLLAAWLRGALKALDGKTREPVPNRSDLSGSWNQPVGASVKADCTSIWRPRASTASRSLFPPACARSSAPFSTVRVLLVCIKCVGPCSHAWRPGTGAKGAANFDGIPGVDAFLAARDKVFRSVREQHLPPGAMPVGHGRQARHRGGGRSRAAHGSHLRLCPVVTGPRIATQWSSKGLSGLLSYAASRGLTRWSFAGTASPVILGVVSCFSNTPLRMIMALAAHCGVRRCSERVGPADTTGPRLASLYRADSR